MFEYIGNKHKPNCTRYFNRCIYINKYIRINVNINSEIPMGFIKYTKLHGIEVKIMSSFIVFFIDVITSCTVLPDMSYTLCEADVYSQPIFDLKI